MLSLSISLCKAECRLPSNQANGVSLFFALIILCFAQIQRNWIKYLEYKIWIFIRKYVFVYMCTPHTHTNAHTSFNQMTKGDYIYMILSHWFRRQKNLQPDHLCIITTQNDWSEQNLRESCHSWLHWTAVFRCVYSLKDSFLIDISAVIQNKRSTISIFVSQFS